MEKRMWRKWISLLMCSFLLAFIQFEIKKWSANEKAHLLSWHHNKSSHSIFQVDGNVCIKYIYVLCSVWSFLGLSNLRNVNVCLCQMQSDIKLATLPNKKCIHIHIHIWQCAWYMLLYVWWIRLSYAYVTASTITRLPFLRSNEMLSMFVVPCTFFRHLNCRCEHVFHNILKSIENI